jgi:hypothetical protein
MSKVKVIFADRTMIGVLDSSVDEVQWLREHSLIPFGEVVRHTYGTQTFVRYENRGQVITAYAYDMPIESLTTEQLGTTILQQQTNQGDIPMHKRIYVININDGEFGIVFGVRHHTAQADPVKDRLDSGQEVAQFKVAVACELVDARLL